VCTTRDVTMTSVLATEAMKFHSKLL